MKDIELKLISELMKNSRRSDRELAGLLKVSQPTVTRTRARLEKEGIIKEYTMIPDFSKLGFQIMSIILSSVREKATPQEIEDSRRKIREQERRNPHALLFGYSGIGLKSDRASILLAKDYSEHATFMEHAKRHPWVNVESMQTFMIDLSDTSHYLPLTFSQVAAYLEKSGI